MKMKEILHKSIELKKPPDNLPAKPSTYIRTRLAQCRVGVKYKIVGISSGETFRSLKKDGIGITSTVEIVSKYNPLKLIFDGKHEWTVADSISDGLLNNILCVPLEMENSIMYR